MPDMAGSYSEILGRPLFMSLPGEQIHTDLPSESSSQPSSLPTSETTNPSHNAAVSQSNGSVHFIDDRTQNDSVEAAVNPESSSSPDCKPKHTKPSSLPCIPDGSSSSNGGSYYRYFSNTAQPEECEVRKSFF